MCSHYNTDGLGDSRKNLYPSRSFSKDRGILEISQNKEVIFMSKQKKQEKRQGRDLRGSAPIAGQNRTDTAVNAQDPMADPLEMRMKREGHDM